MYSLTRDFTCMNFTTLDLSQNIFESDAYNQRPDTTYITEKKKGFRAAAGTPGPS